MNLTRLGRALSSGDSMKQARACCLLFALASGTCGAQDFEPVALLQETSAEYVIRHWGMAEGLPSDRVRAVVQTSDGYIWAATFNGLGRFDGVRFQVFDDANTPALKNRLINCLFEDSHHRLWIGSDTGEIAW